jgi:hypothetical protein
LRELQREEAFSTNEEPIHAQFSCSLICVETYRSNNIIKCNFASRSRRLVLLLTQHPGRIYTVYSVVKVGCCVTAEKHGLPILWQCWAEQTDLQRCTVSQVSCTQCRVDSSACHPWHRCSRDNHHMPARHTQAAQA